MFYLHLSPLYFNLSVSNTRIKLAQVQQMFTVVNYQRTIGKNKTDTIQTTATKTNVEQQTDTAAETGPAATCQFHLMLNDHNAFAFSALTLLVGQ